MERTRFAPWGAHGGLPGVCARPVLVNPGTPKERVIRKIDILRLEPGDVVEMRSAGGGGYGDPLDRDPARVSEDVELGFVSRQAAEDIYGAAFDAEGCLDERATQVRRGVRRAARGDAAQPDYAFGDYRLAHEQVWTAAARETLSQVLAGLPVLLRYRVKNELHTMLKGKALAPEDVCEAWHTVHTRLGLGRYLKSLGQAGRPD
jgi:N-methylhydantoinase B